MNMFIKWFFIFCDKKNYWKLTDPFGLEAATYAKYCITFLVFSVLPAPDSPVHRIDWSSRSKKRKKKPLKINSLGNNNKTLLFKEVVKRLYTYEATLKQFVKLT